MDQEFTLVKKSQVPHSRDLTAVVNGYPECVQVVSTILFPCMVALLYQKGPKVLKRLTVIVEDSSLLHVLVCHQHR